MKKTLLFGLFAGAASMGMAQKNVGTARMLEPMRTDGSRAIDTVYMSSLDTGNPALYGVENDGGYMFGTNTYGDKAKVQQFLLDGEAGATEILFWFGAKSDVSGSPASVVNANLYALDGAGTTLSGETNYAPGTVLATVPLTLAEIDSSSTLAFTVAQFPNTVYVGTEFAAGFDFSALAAGDSVALVSTTNGEVQFGEFTWEKWSDNTWWTLPAAGWGNNTFDADLYIFVVIDDEFVGVGENGSLNNSRMSFLNGNISNGTVLVSYDVVEAGRMNLMVHNSRGQVVTEQAFGTQGVGNYTYTLSTEGWAPGNYYVTLKNNGRPLTKKLVVR
ncbi:MAG TPA: T9SS type A sorting domain-containing protein [Flavobacteriales bacterium]|nr:T9SS type A sorting domain-containing protein [Flavobacteriales bacterium]